MSPKPLFLAIAIYLLATFVFLYPLPFHLSDRVFENGDTYLVTWLLAWQTHALTTPHTSFFNGNIFFPEANTLALSELVLPDQFIFAPVLGLTHNPLVAYNLTLVLSFPLSAISMLLLVFYLTQRFSGAFLAGFIFGFTPIRLSHLHHLQLLSLMWLPLIFLFFDRWLEKDQWRDALATALLFAAQYLTTVYIALYLVPVLLLYFILHSIIAKKKWRPRFLSQVVVASILSSVALLPFLNPYRLLLRQWDFHSQESLKIFFSSDLWLNLLATFPTNVLYGKLFHSFSAPPYERFYFTGFAAILLALMAWNQRHGRIVKIFFGLSIISYLIALGPLLQFSGHVTGIPLPYRWLIDPLPGFSMLRVPARAGLILLATMVVLAAYGWIHFVEWSRTKLGSRGMKFSETRLCTLMILLLGLEFLSIPIPLLPAVSGAHIPPVYHFLKSYPEQGGVLEIPVVFHEDGGEPVVRVYTYFSTYHFKPIVISYSGYFPPPFQDLVATARRLPAEDALDVFEAIGVRTIVLHRQQMSPIENQAWQSALKSSPRLKEIKEFPDGDEVMAIQPRLRISQNLGDAYWNLVVQAPPPGSKGQIEASLQTTGLRSQTIDFLVNPQLPHLPDRPEARVGMCPAAVEWLDSERRVVYRQSLKVRLPYLLNRVTVPIHLETPGQPGDYSLRLVLLESPSMGISVNVSIP